MANAAAQRHQNEAKNVAMKILFFLRDKKEV
jgi:hypothetical protein